LVDQPYSDTSVVPPPEVLRLLEKLMLALVLPGFEPTPPTKSPMPLHVAE
jgi:hypothetical protein